MSLRTSKIYIDNSNPVADNEVVSKKYVNDNFLKKTVLFEDIPKDNLTGLNLSFSDMAQDILNLRQKIMNNSKIQEYINQYENNNNPTSDDLKNMLTNINLILTNICRNFVNDPNSVCFNPNCFYKKVQLLTSSGQVFIEAQTYRNDAKGISRDLHLNRDIIYAEIKENIFNDQIGTTTIKYNPSNLTLDNLSSFGVVRKRRIVALTEPDLNFPLPEQNILPSSKTPVKYEIAQDLSSTQEVIDASSNMWGWTSRLGSHHFLGYSIAHNVELPVTDEFYTIIRLSYQLY